MLFHGANPYLVSGYFSFFDHYLLLLHLTVCLYAEIDDLQNLPNIIVLFPPRVCSLAVVITPCTRNVQKWGISVKFSPYFTKYNNIKYSNTQSWVCSLAAVTTLYVLEVSSNGGMDIVNDTSPKPDEDPPVAMTTGADFTDIILMTSLAYDDEDE